MKAKCEHGTCEANGSEWVIYGVEDDGSDVVFILCDHHAPEEGFCIYCGYFVLGTGDERTLSTYGICAPCFAEQSAESEEAVVEIETGFLGAKGLFDWNDQSEPAEDTISRIRNGGKDETE